MKDNKNSNLYCVSISVISNIGLNPIFVSALNEVLLKNRIKAQISFISVEELYVVSNVDIIKKSDYIINWFDIYNNSVLNLDVIGNDLVNYFDSYCVSTLYYIRSITKSKILCLSLTDFSCRDDIYMGSLLNETVIRCNLSIVEKQDALGLNIINLEKIISKCGYKESYSYKDYIRWNSKYSYKLYKSVAYEFYKYLLADKGITKKCIVIDCDNVLWGGVLSEDGIAGIQIGESGLGRPFQDFQSYLLDLYYHGVILAVSSKNDSVDVLRVFREHTGMLLKEEHIACFRCNWENKPDNIRSISEILNIGIDSIVFVDDSAFEIESVKAMLPEVTTVLYKRDTIYDELSCFNLKRDVDTQVVRERTNTYKTNVLRSELNKNLSSYEDYVSSLKMVVDIHETKNHELARISDLTQRTNKCTNGRRYTLEKLKEKVALHNYRLYTVYLSDRFSNLGIVGVIGIENNCLDLFSLSCRALGRGIEEKMLQMVEKEIDNVFFAETGKNQSLIDIIKSLGIDMSE